MLQPLPASPTEKPPNLSEIFRANGPFVYRALRRLGVREADMDDACQEVFIVVHRRYGDFEGRSSLRTWLYGIAVRVASAFRRRAHNKRETMESSPDAEDAANAESDYQKRQLLQMLDEALSTLDDDKRAAFVLYEVEELTMAEVAEALGCPLQTAYSRLTVARERVQKVLLRKMEERRR
ncbi:MAG: sigma-70 family RNA polymerase sigma factor [Polyangiaceae bacterium]|nr:sigma-70 family RNA polymerase sigma factor [Polyangiaceae bacterium]